jgi:hypothetical protein
LNSVLHVASTSPEVLAAIMYGVLLGPVAPTQEQRAHIGAPTLIVGHRKNLLHPFDDAANLAHQLPDAEFVKARSPFELRLCPQRLTVRVAEFLRDVWEPVHASRDPRRSSSAGA